MRILIVEDEDTIREQLAERFKSEGFAVELASDGEEGLYLATEFEFDAAIVDLGLPGISGMDLIQKVRDANIKLPILILTARASWQDKVQGLKSGSDDYVVKPFHMEEVVARINALVRRSAGHASPVLEFSGVKLDTLTHDVRANDQRVDLTSFEYKVLEFLMLHGGQVISKAVLTEHLYAQDFDRDSNVIEVFIARLRKKLESTGLESPIETLRGRGYRFKTED